MQRRAVQVYVTRSTLQDNANVSLCFDYIIEFDDVRMAHLLVVNEKMVKEKLARVKKKKQNASKEEEFKLTRKTEISRSTLLMREDESILSFLINLIATCVRRLFVRH